MPGYDELQEGLAVLAEHLVGQLSRPRIRTLAARVLAAHTVLRDATFVDTFRELTRGHGVDRRSAFTIAMRVHRGGGYVKDAVYLRGLVRVLEYVGSGRPLRPLWVGKISTRDVPFVLELERRGILSPPPLVPRFLDRPTGQARLERIRAGATVWDLLRRSAARGSSRAAGEAVPR
jgi:uncharacterized protein (TIGR02421 family)